MACLVGFADVGFGLHDDAAQPLAVDRALNGADLCTNLVFFIEEGRTVADSEIATSPRISIRSDEVARSRPWRFYIKGNRCVSR